jgi:hypothetical protein
MGKLLSVICSFAGTTAAARCAFAALLVATRPGLLSLLFSSSCLFFTWMGPGGSCFHFQLSLGLADPLQPALTALQFLGIDDFGATP